jgi:hypothetical protein
MKTFSKLILAGIVGSATLSLVAASLPDNVVNCQPNTGCVARKMFDRNYKVLSTPRAEVMVSISTEGDYTRADISILNNDGFPIKINPDDFRVEVISPKPHVLAYVAPASLQGVAPELPTPEPPPPAAKPDPTVPINIDELYAAKKKRLAMQEIYDRAVAQHNLAATSVEPSQVVRGRVYFERDKKATQVNLTIPIAGVVYQFPYTLQ